MKIKLSKTYNSEGKEFRELDIDFDRLTGKDLVDASKEARILGDVSPVQELSPTYLAVVGAKAAGISIDTVLALSAKDFTSVKTETQNFLLG